MTAILALGNPLARMTEDEREWLWMHVQRQKADELELLMNRHRKLENLELSEFEDSVMHLAFDLHILCATRRVGDLQADVVAIFPGYEGTRDRETWVGRGKRVVVPRFDGATHRLSKRQKQAKLESQRRRQAAKKLGKKVSGEWGWGA